MINRKTDNVTDLAPFACGPICVVYRLRCQAAAVQCGQHSSATSLCADARCNRILAAAEEAFAELGASASTEEVAR